MNRRRTAAVLFFSAVVVATFAVIVYTEHANATQTIAVWRLTHDVTAGAAYSADDVEQVRIPVAGATLNFESLGPDQVTARYSRDLRAQDVLRVDDLATGAADVEVALTLQNAPQLSAGDRVDIFAALPSGQQARIGRAVTVMSVAGGFVDVLVPASDEAAWVAVGASSTVLHGVRTSSLGDPQAAPLDAGDAISILCGSSCGPLTATAPSPSP